MFQVKKILNSQTKISKSNSRTNKPFCKVCDKHRLSCELFSPITSLSWGISGWTGWTPTPNTDCAPKAFGWWKESYLWSSHLKSRNFSRLNSILKRGIEYPKNLCWVSLSLNLYSTQPSVLSLTLRDGFWLDHHQQWLAPLKSTCEKLAFSSCKKYSVK